MAKYIYQYKNWTNFTWDDKKLALILGNVRNLQGRILGQMLALGFFEKEEAALTNLTLDVLKSSEIEGEKLSKIQVRSSIARHLGINIADSVSSPRNVDGIVEMMLDATQNYRDDLTEERLLGWHSALFPSGRSGLYKIDIGRYRSGDMQVVSGPMGREKVHYEAPPASDMQKEMDLFLAWINKETKIDPVIKAAVAHFWFVTIHPFDDGNGRIARTISDMLLARSDESSQRFYSMSNQILAERKKYYTALQETQINDTDITIWLDWFISCLYRALQNTETVLQKTFRKADFWNKHAKTPLNDRQRLMLNKLLDGFKGKLQTSKWAKITKCSTDTALRDIKDLMEKGILRQESEGGRSTNYELIEF